VKLANENLVRSSVNAYRLIDAEDKKAFL